MTYPPNPWPFPVPNPPVGDRDQDQTPRWGEGTPLPVKMSDNYPGKAAGSHKKLTVTNAATRLTNVTGATQMILQVQDAPIRFRVDGSDVTATGGYYCEPGDTIHLTSPEDIRGFLAIRTTSTNATLYIQAFM